MACHALNFPFKLMGLYAESGSSMFHLPPSKRPIDEASPKPMLRRVVDSGSGALGFGAGGVDGALSVRHLGEYDHRSQGYSMFIVPHLSG
jgi:hypothetical protein